jgi:6-phosphogluconate dehydrogenase
MVGLGRMGANMARRLARAGVAIHGVDPDAGARAALDGTRGITTHQNLDGTLAALPSPRTVWLMLPAGSVTQSALDLLFERLAPGDLVIDGGNADHRDSRRRAEAFAARGLHFADCGVSGGIWGLEDGYCLMFGADPAGAPRVAALARLLAPAPDRGWLHCGPPGAGHFVKMIHNGIEYAAMQAYAEGFALLDGSEYGLDLAAVGETWRHGSVIRSWLLDLTVAALAEPGALDAVQPFVADSGEGRWAVEEAIRSRTPVPAIALALMSRFDSQGRADTANRLLALMRKGFGGHPVRTE